LSQQWNLCIFVPIHKKGDKINYQLRTDFLLAFFCAGYLNTRSCIKFEAKKISTCLYLFTRMEGKAMYKEAINPSKMWQSSNISESI